MSFWINQSDINKEQIELLRSAFNVTGNLYLEFVNTREPELYDPSNEKKSEEISLQSEILPKLKPNELINLLVKVHTNGYNSLNPLEKKLVDEYRGHRNTTPPPEKKRHIVNGD